MNVAFARGQVDCHVGHVQEVIGEIFLDHITPISKADDEIGDDVK